MPGDINQLENASERFSTNVESVAYVSETILDRLRELQLYGIGIENGIEGVDRAAFVAARMTLSLTEDKLSIGMLRRGVFYQARLNSVTASLARTAIESNVRRGYRFDTERMEWRKGCR